MIKFFFMNAKKSEIVNNIIQKNFRNNIINNFIKKNKTKPFIDNKRIIKIGKSKKIIK